jgi:hypothetical protein
MARSLRGHPILPCETLHQCSRRLHLDSGISQIIDMETSYIIVSCDAKKLGTAPSLESKRAEIERMISQEKSKASIDRWMESVRKKHVIKKY